jgi:hypothetical protein
MSMPPADLPGIGATPPPMEIRQGVWRIVLAGFPRPYALLGPLGEALQAMAIQGSAREPDAEALARAVGAVTGGPVTASTAAGTITLRSGPGRVATPPLRGFRPAAPPTAESVPEPEPEPLVLRPDQRIDTAF